MNAFCVSWRLRLVVISLSAVVMAAHFWGGKTFGQGAAYQPFHLPSDWSQQVVLFPPPTSLQQAWQFQREPRYQFQLARRSARTLNSANAAVPGSDATHRDWAMSLGSMGTVGAGQYPAKFGFDVNTVSCTDDYVAFTTSLPGSSTVPSVVAFDNLYTTQGSVGGFCNADGPSVKWAYNTNPAGDTTGTTNTSIVLSIDGTMIAYVESRTNAHGGAILQILKWKPGSGLTVQGTIAAPATPDTIMAPGQAWNTTNCPAANSCLVSLVFSGAQPDTNSPPFYLYGTDELYVGDNNGVLHKFTGVFLGTPAEVVTGGWPITVNAGHILTGPVYDFNAANIFVGDNSGRLSFAREVGSTVGTCAAGSPPCLASISQSLTGSIVDPPPVDSSNGRVYAFDNDTTNHGSVFQFDDALTSGSEVIVNVGGSSNQTGAVIYSGGWDDAFFSIGPASGHLYTCGKDHSFSNRPAMYQLTFNSSGVLNTTTGTPLLNLVNANSIGIAACSPITEFLNGSTDRIFFSVAGHANPPSSGGTATGCTAGQGCVMSLVLGGTWPPTATTAGIPASGGASGIILDNNGTGAQESNIYYTYRSNSTTSVTCNGTTGVGCAVKATQSALQ
jgi:hypothetical protein